MFGFASDSLASCTHIDARIQHFHECEYIEQFQLTKTVTKNITRTKL